MQIYQHRTEEGWHILVPVFCAQNGICCSVSDMYPIVFIRGSVSIEDWTVECSSTRVKMKSQTCCQIPFLIAGMMHCRKDNLVYICMYMFVSPQHKEKVQYVCVPHPASAHKPSTARDRMQKVGDELWPQRCHLAITKTTTCYSSISKTEISFPVFKKSNVNNTSSSVRDPWSAYPAPTSKNSSWQAIRGFLIGVSTSSDCRLF